MAEESKTTHHKTKNFDATYHIAKWLTTSFLKNRIEAIKKKNFGYGKKATRQKSVFDLFTGRGVNEEEEQQKALDYWDDNVKLFKKYTEEQIKAVYIIQQAFQAWLLLKRLRTQWKITSSAGKTDNGAFVQNSIRMWLAKRELSRQAKEYQETDAAFVAFCKKISTGVTLRMFGKTYGKAYDREIKFNESCTAITFKASTFNVREIPLATIYAVKQGFSGYDYTYAKPIKKSLCFHFRCLGGRVYDFEASSRDDFNQYLKGFQHLQELVYTQACFFVDANGIPRRAGPSAIQSALDRKAKGPKSFKSEAQEMNFRLAVDTLKKEYDLWQKEKAREYREFEQERAEFRKKSRAGGAVDDDDDEEENRQEAEEKGDDDDDDDDEPAASKNMSKLMGLFSFSSKKASATARQPVTTDLEDGDLPGRSAGKIHVCQNNEDLFIR